MPETGGGGAEIPNIELPNALRIRQRLGQVSTEHAFKQNLVPQVEALGKLSMPPAELIERLEGSLTNYAENHVIGMIPFVLEGMMPRIIDGLVSDEQQKKLAFRAWEERVTELKGSSVATSQHIQNRYLNPQRKIPRKQKKASRRGPKYRI